MGKFNLFQNNDGQYYFNLKADNGEIILKSEGYTSKLGCMNGIAAVKFNAQLDSNFIRRSDAKGLFYFILKASNGAIIGTSEFYSNNLSRENGIRSVKNTAPSSIINDLS